MSKRQSGPEAGSFEERSGKSRNWLLAVGLFVFVVAVYFPSYRYGYLYDENVILFRQFPPRTFGELIEKAWSPHFPGLEYFRPVPHATYLVQYMWHRNEPGYFHVFNALLMGFTACVSFAFLRLPCFRISPIPAALAAALFAVHPASSSCVTPIVGRETLMGAGLTIGAVYAFFRGGQAWYVASIFLLALALLSKEHAVVIPILFVLGDILGLSTNAPGRSVRRWLCRYAPVVIVLLAYLAIRWSQFSGSEYKLEIFEHPFGPLASAGHTLQTIFVPFVELAYEPAFEVWFSPSRLVIASVLLCLLGGMVIRREKVPQKSALFWLGWSLVSIAPTANVIQQQAPYSERFVLLAILAVVAVAASVVSSLGSSASARRVTVFIGLILVAASSAVSIHRGRCFENTLTFSRQWAKTSPAFSEAQMALGIELHLLGRTEEAVERFNAGLESDPDSRGFFHSWLGKMRLIQGDFAEAEQHFQILIGQDPQERYNYYLSGLACLGLKDADNAIARFEQALGMSAQFGGAVFLLGDTLELQGRTSLAGQHMAFASTLPVIDLSFSRIDDSHLEILSRFSNLRYLLLESTSISDVGLEHLRGATSLNRLWMPGTGISDRGLSYLRDLPNLSSLVLTNTRITDEGVAYLLSMKSLRHLDVRNTEITPEGLRKLKSGLTDCLILH